MKLFSKIGRVCCQLLTRKNSRKNAIHPSKLRNAPNSDPPGKGGPAVPETPTLCTAAQGEKAASPHPASPAAELSPPGRGSGPHLPPLQAFTQASPSTGPASAVASQSSTGRTGSADKNASLDANSEAIAALLQDIHAAPVPRVSSQALDIRSPTSSTLVKKQNSHGSQLHKSRLLDRRDISSSQHLPSAAASRLCIAHSQSPSSFNAASQANPALSPAGHRSPFPPAAAAAAAHRIGTELVLRSRSRAGAASTDLILSPGSGTGHGPHFKRQDRTVSSGPSLLRATSKRPDLRSQLLDTVRQLPSLQGSFIESKPRTSAPFLTDAVVPLAIEAATRSLVGETPPLLPLLSLNGRN